MYKTMKHIEKICKDSIVKTEMKVSRKEKNITTRVLKWKRDRGSEKMLGGRFEDFRLSTRF